jgi:hypothetical protein
MSGEEYMRGFAAGWTAASEALSRALGAMSSGEKRSRSAMPLRSAGGAAHRRGRPPKSAPIANQPKRRRGRPPKAAE